MDLEKLGTIVAIIVGVLAIFRAFREAMKERRKVIIDCEEKDEKWSDTTSDKKSIATNISQLSNTYKSITVHATNNDKRPLTIVAAGFYLSDGGKIEKSGQGTNLPKRIEYEEEISISFPVASLQRELMNRHAKASIINKISKRVRKFIENPRIGIFRFRSPIYYDYVVETNNTKGNSEVK